MIQPEDFLSAAEVRRLCGDISLRTLERWRLKYWAEGVHYVQPGGHRILYIKPMLTDWLINGRANPAAHQRAMADWVAQYSHLGKGRKKQA